MTETAGKTGTAEPREPETAGNFVNSGPRRRLQAGPATDRVT